jgi:hypothetical protein
MLKRFAHRLRLQGISEDREEHPGVRMVLTHLYVGQGDHPHARILQLDPDDIGQFALYLVRNAAGSGIVLGHAQASV